MRIKQWSILFVIILAFSGYFIIDIYSSDNEPVQLLASVNVEYVEVPSTFVESNVKPLPAVETPTEKEKVAKVKLKVRQEPKVLSQEELYQQMIDEEYLEKGHVSRSVATYIYCRKFYKEVLEQQFCEGYHSVSGITFNFNSLVRIIEGFGAGDSWSVDAAIDIDALVKDKYYELQQEYRIQQAQCNDVACLIPFGYYKVVNWKDFDSFKIDLRNIGFDSLEFSKRRRTKQKIIILRYSMSTSDFFRFWKRL